MMILFFVLVQKAVDFTENNCSKVRFIALAIEQMSIEILYLEEKNPHDDFLGVDKYLFPNYKFDIDLLPSFEIKAPCLEVIQGGSMLTKIRPQKLCKYSNQGSIDQYADLLFTLVTRDVWKKKSQIIICSVRFIVSEKILVSSISVPHVLWKIKAWKGMIGHPIYRGKDMNLNLRTSFLKKGSDIVIKWQKIRLLF